MRTLIPLVIVLLVGVSLLPPVHCGFWSSYYRWRNKLTHWTELEFKAKDIIACHIAEKTYHILLATSSDTVAHLIRYGSSDVAYLEEEPWSDYHERKGDEQDLCRVYGRASRSDAIERARKDIDYYGTIYYSLFNCNCEHWVMYWAKGRAFSGQTGMGPGRKCEIGKYHD